MSLYKLSLAGNNLINPGQETLVRDARMWTGKQQPFFTVYLPPGQELLSCELVSIPAAATDIYTKSTISTQITCGGPRRYSGRLIYSTVSLWERLPGTEAVFLDVIGTKVFRVFLFAIHSHLY
jgi:hypothetical protein